MSLIKTEKEIQIMREGGKRLAHIMAHVAAAAKEGVASIDLDTLARKLIEGGGDKPAFLNYKPEGATRGFPATLCVSINDEMVHGIPTKEKIFKNGDIVSLDLGLIHNGLVSDMNLSFGIGKLDAQAQKLITVAKQALDTGIAEVKPGAGIGNIGFAVESFVNKNGFQVSHELGGHGVGKHVHEDPHISHFGRKNTGLVMKEGMVFTIEPTVTEGSSILCEDVDGFTLKTADGKRSAQFEHTILVTKDGAEVLTVV